MLPEPLKSRAERVFKGRKFDVCVVEVDGRRREVVDHHGAVVVLPIMDDGRIILIRNERFAVGKTLLELPAGTLEPGEDPADCAGRELIEETGYKAAAIDRLCDYYSTPGFCTELLFAFEARRLTHVGQALEEGEKITIAPTPIDEALAMVRDGRIEDAKTIAALLYHQVFRRSA